MGCTKSTSTIEIDYEKKLLEILKKKLIEEKLLLESAGGENIKKSTKSVLDCWGRHDPKRIAPLAIIEKSSIVGIKGPETKDGYTEAWTIDEEG